ncbi:HupE/UreJ family protein [Flavobacteriaceae bacterium]|nr:HupE/UreJ family protein [Flavobacteriaceae bacterium]
MEILRFYLDLGFWHVIDWDGLDHLYFIVSLALPFGFKESKKLLLLITIFTLGHTFSLAANFYGNLFLHSYWIELLIPITIAINTASLLLPKRYIIVSKEGFLLPLVTLFFGIIHGLGFGRYFSMLTLEEAVGFSLFSFALGVELAQGIIVIGTLCLSFLVLKIINVPKAVWEIAIGSLILALALAMIFERI